MACSSHAKRTTKQAVRKEVEAMTATIVMLLLGAIALTLLAIDRYRERHAPR